MKRLLFVLLFSSQLNAMLIKKGESLFVPRKLGALDVVKTDEGVEVIKASKRHKIHSYDVDPFLNKLDNEQLALFLQDNKMAISQLDNEDYKLKALGGLKGGGPIAGLVAGLAVRAVLYTAGAVATIVPGPGSTAAVVVVPAYVAGTEYAANTAQETLSAYDWLP